MHIRFIFPLIQKLLAINKVVSHGKELLGLFQATIRAKGSNFYTSCYKRLVIIEHHSQLTKDYGHPRLRHGCTADMYVHACVQTYEQTEISATYLFD